jgi:tRNA threonylcarbamoyladenosine biosynthesis protein TsaB
MNVLGIETSTARSSVALLVDGEVVVHVAHEDARGHGAFLAPAMRRCLDSGHRVDAVAVGTGPGLYTGLRVGMATASAFASARGIPVVGVGGMDALMLGCGVGDTTVVTTLDARRGQVFWAVHEPGAGDGARDGARDGAEADESVRVDGPRVGSRDELDAVVEELASRGPVAVVGEIGAADVLRPDAADTARLALRTLAATSHDALVPEALVPVYLRDADVRIGWAERGGVRGGEGPAAGATGAGA